MHARDLNDLARVAADTAAAVHLSAVTLQSRRALNYSVERSYGRGSILSSSSHELQTGSFRNRMLYLSAPFATSGETYLVWTRNIYRKRTVREHSQTVIALLYTPANLKVEKFDVIG